MDAGCKIICQVETLAQAREAADVGAPIASSRRDALLAAIRASREARWDLCRLWSIFRRPDRRDEIVRHQCLGQSETCRDPAPRHAHSAPSWAVPHNPVFRSAAHESQQP
jgi:hypothetical protein